MTDKFCTQHYGTWERIREAQAFAEKRLSEKDGKKAQAIPSYTVLCPSPLKPTDLARRTAKKGGFSARDIKLASAAAHEMDRLGLPLFSAVVADQFAKPGFVRGKARDFKSDVARAQKRSGLDRTHWLEMMEGEPALHSNILFPLGLKNTTRLLQGLSRSKKYPGDLLKIQDAESGEAFVSYCSKERLPEAAFVGGVGKLAPRLPGSHQLEGGGDRVRISKALAQDQEPRSRHYAARRPAPVVPQSQPVAIPDPHGLFGKLPEQPTPPKEWARTGPHRFKLIVLDQASLPLERRPDVIDLMARLGPTHEAIAARIGRSRPQATNILNRQFGCSRQVARRVLHLALAA